MTTRTVRPERRLIRRVPSAGWATAIPVALMVVSLVSLLFTTVMHRRRIEPLRDRLMRETGAARMQVVAVERSVAITVAAAQGFAASGDPRFAADFRATSGVLPAELAALRGAAERAGIAVEGRLDRLEIVVGSWLRPMEEMAAGSRSRSDYVAGLPEQQARLEAIRAHLRELDDGIVARETELRAEIARLDRLRARGTVGPALLALLATAAVAHLTWRLRRTTLDLRRRAEEEVALRQAARALSEATTVEEVVARVVEGAVHTTAAIGAYVEQTTGDVVRVAGVFGDGVPAVGTQAPFPGSLTDAIVASGEPGLITEVSQIGESMAPYLREACPGCSGLVVPLTSEGRVLGALVLLRPRNGAPFGPAEAAHARALADLASAALRRVILLDSARREHEAVKASEAQFRAVVENSNAAVFVITSDDGIVFVNGAATRTFGYEVSELMGQPLTMLMPPHLRARHRAGVERYVATGRRNIRWEGTLLVGRHKDGHEVPIEVSFGEFVREGRRYFAGIAQDVTERERHAREREEALRREEQARAQAEAATAARDQVLAIVSHDLRNPLNTVSMAAETMARGAAPADALAVVRRSVKRMSRLIQDLLDVSRLEAGQALNVSRGPVDVAGMVDDTCGDLRPEAEGKGIAFSWRVEAGLPPVEGDRDRLAQTLGNIVANALKFTPEGGEVTVTAERTGDAVRIEVRDTGPGIPAADLDRVFEPYWQARRTGRLGSGLGLAIAKAIVDAHGGRIGADSEAGHGSAFWFTVPAATG